MSDLDMVADHNSLSAWCQHRKGRPLCPGRGVFLFSGHGHRRLSRGSMGSRAHKPGREAWCTPKCHSHTHCRWRGVWRGEIKA